MKDFENCQRGVCQKSRSNLRIFGIEIQYYTGCCCSLQQYVLERVVRRRIGCSGKDGRGAKGSCCNTTTTADPSQIYLSFVPYLVILFFSFLFKKNCCKRGDILLFSRRHSIIIITIILLWTKQCVCSK